MKKWSRPTSTVVLLACIGITLFAITLQTWWTIRVDREISIEQVRKDQLTTIRSIEEHAFQTIQDADRTISATIEVIESDGGSLLQDPVALRQVLIRERQNTAHVQSLRFITSAGISSVTTFEDPLIKIDISDRVHVRRMLDDPISREIHVGPPIKSRYDGKWVLPVIRNIHARDGKRLGMLCAYLALDYFNEYYERITDALHARVTIYSDDGIVMLDWPLDVRLLGADISHTANAKRMLAGPREGFFESAADNNAEPLLLAYRKLAALPLTVVYTYRLDEALARWQQRTNNRLLFSGPITGLILLLTFFLLQHIRRLHRSEAHLAANENRYRILYESATDAIVLINRQHIYVDCNPAALILFDVGDKNQLIGKHFGDAMPSAPLTGEKQHDPATMIALALDGQPQLFEWAMLRKGTPFFNEITLSRGHINGEELLVAVFRDINARKRAEMLQESQNQILHMISAGIELQRILRTVTQFFSRHAPGARTIVLLVSTDLSSFTSAVGHDFPPEFLARVGQLPIADHSTTMAEAALTRCPVPAPLLPGATSTGLSEPCSSWPIMGQRGQILGVLSVFQQPESVPGSEQIQLIGIATDLASIAIESRHAEQRIRRLAHYDELTGLPNRVLCGQQLDKALLHARRHARQVGVLFLDLDRFKNINDTFGHDAGDAVLREVALRFLDCLRTSDLIARVGGDEFIVLVDGYDDTRELADIAQELLRAASRPFDIASQECQLGASIGIATFPQDGHTAQTLLKNADIAMYRAKEIGKNNYQYYSVDMNTHSVERLALEARLKRAIERREFVMHYQPKIDIATGRIAGAEALVRWNHPERGLVSPAEFINLAEDTGLIGALGMLVLDATCADINTFGLAGIEVGRIAINLSGSQFNEVRLLDEMMHVVRARQVDPSALEFEITEGAVMHNPEQAITLMAGMIQLGFTLAIDDFGTGYSSLAYLKRFPVGSVKIDKSFIDDIPGDPNDSAIVRAIIVMARTLGMKVVAEGVETRSQLATLEEFGCDAYQGYFFSKPIPADDFIALARQTTKANGTA